MFNESTENLLDDLENELTKAVEFENPEDDLKVIESEKDEMPPIPAKRNLVESSVEHLANPIPAARKLQSLDKNEKNDENEIIQLSSMSSSSPSENQRNMSQNTIVIASERKGNGNNKILFVQEADTAEDSFFVTKHGKWAQDEKDLLASDENPKELTLSPGERTFKSKPPHIEIISEKPVKSSTKPELSTSTSSAAQTSFESSSETSSSSESLKTKKKSKKKLKDKEKKKSKKKFSSGDQVSSTENSIKKDEHRIDSGHAIGKNFFFILLLGFCKEIF